MGCYLIHTTYPILFISVFARQLGLPIPAILFLLAEERWQAPVSLASLESCRSL
jgi:hypothetical protein